MQVGAKVAGGCFGEKMHWFWEACEGEGDPGVCWNSGGVRAALNCGKRGSVRSIRALRV